MAGRLSLGAVDALRPGQVKIVLYPGGQAPKKSLLLALTPEGPRAYWNVCRHLPVPLDGGMMRLDGLVCLTHGARYRASDGLCEEGPCAGDALEAVPLVQEGQELYALLED